MESIKELVQKVQNTEYRFKEIQKEVGNVTGNNSVKECINISNELFSSKVSQARMLATFVFGLVASKSKESLNFLKKNVSEDENWRVQEILAKSLPDLMVEDVNKTVDFYKEILT